MSRRMVGILLIVRLGAMSRLCIILNEGSV